MSLSPRSSLHRRVVALLGGALVTAAFTAQVPAASAAPASSALRQATGYAASQLSARPACGAAKPGQIRCLAQVLTVKASGATASVLRVPQATSSTSAPAEYTAGFLQWAYDTTWLSANRGAADTVAVVDAYGDSSAYSDMQQFRSANGLPGLPTCSTSVATGCFELVNQYGQPSPLPTNANDHTGSWNIEESLDIDAVSAICPLCKLIVVEANSSGSADLDAGVATAAQLGANQISLSWGALSYPAAIQNDSPYNTITSSAVLAAAGDGSYQGSQVNYPAALASVTAVGGTSLTSDPNMARGVSETTWSMQTCADGSTCGTESGCDTSQSTPSYQSGITTDCSGRAYNDISADADPNTGLEIYDSQRGSEGCGTMNHWCIAGGTSLATPLTAAFEGVAAITDVTPDWAYAEAPLLNDIVAGSDGACQPGFYLICNAAAGWDGPTGNGSFSGDVTSGAPGVGADTASGVNAQDVTLSGGVYPNGSAPVFYWQYWVHGSAGTTFSTPAATTTGPSLQAVSDTLCSALSANTTYDYRLVASGSGHTVYGYQGSFTTAATESTPTASEAPTISGSAMPGQTLAAQPGTWNDQSCNSSPTYQWQEAPSINGPWSTVATSLNYPLTTADVGEYLRFVTTESNAVGTGTAASSVVGPVTVPVSVTTTPTTTNPTTTNPTTTSPTTTAPTTTVTETVRFFRCARACEPIDTHGANRYRPGKADYGRYIKIVTTVMRTSDAITTAQVSTRWVGPVTSSTAGVVSIGGGAHAAAVLGVRTRGHRLLARVRIARRTRRTLTLVIGRSGRNSARVWAYVVSRGAVVSCSPSRALGRTVRLTLAVRPGQTVKLVAVST